MVLGMMALVILEVVVWLIAVDFYDNSRGWWWMMLPVAAGGEKKLMMIVMMGDVSG